MLPCSWPVCSHCSCITLLSSCDSARRTARHCLVEVAGRFQFDLFLVELDLLFGLDLLFELDLLFYCQELKAFLSFTSTHYGGFVSANLMLSFCFYHFLFFSL